MSDGPEPRKAASQPVLVKAQDREFWSLTSFEQTDCRRCNQKIIFAVTKKGKWIALDAPTHEKAPCAPHWETCPSSKYFVGKKTVTPGGLPPPPDEI